MTERRWQRCWLGLMLGLAVRLPACNSDGHLDLFGYTTKPNYDSSIRTVRVPIFKNDTYWRGIEFELTRAVINEIESKPTGFKVVPAYQPADTELLGKVVGRSKATVGVNQLGEIRDAELTLTVEVTWRDLRPGMFGDPLAKPQPDPTQPGQPQANPATPHERVLVQSLGGYRPELGESRSFAHKQMVSRLAVQIVSMMEQPW